MTISSTNGLASIKVGGNVYPLVSASGCKTCGSKHRLEIEQALVKGYSPSQVLRQLPEGHNLFERNIRDHFAAGHLPLKAAAIEKLVQEHANERERVVEAGAEVLTSHAAFARAVVGRVRDRVANGEIEPEVKDALMATRLLYEFEEPSAMDHGTLVRALCGLIEIVKANVTAEQFNEIGRRVKSDPVLSALGGGAVDGA